MGLHITSTLPVLVQQLPEAPLVAYEDEFTAGGLLQNLHGALAEG
jgi:hypothetical protein